MDCYSSGFGFNISDNLLAKRKKKMNRKIAAIAISVFLISPMAMLQIVPVAKANFIPGYLQVIIDSPVQKNYETNTIVLSVIIKGNQDYYANGSDRSTRWIGYGLDGNANVSLGSGVFVDGKQAYGSPQAWIYSIYVANTTLTSLSEGQHNLTVYAENKYNPGLGEWDWNNPYIISAYSTANFTITAKSQNPSPTNAATLNVSLSESASALNYGNTVNFTVLADGGTKPYTFAWYVDNQLAETSSSQYFSTDSLAVGSHHVYVKVTDADNNSATTLTVEFNVLPVSSNSPSLSPSLSSSPTPIEVIPFVDPPDPTRSYIFYSMIIPAILFAVGFTIYLAKRRRVKQ
jgi:hypothetical protein